MTPAAGDGTRATAPHGCPAPVRGTVAAAPAGPAAAAGPDAPSAAATSPAARGTLAEAAAFAAVGAAAYAADLGVFVWLRGPAGLGPLTAKALSFLAGCTVAYAGNALGTYRGRVPAAGRTRQYAAFFAVNLAGALVQLLCLALSHYALGLTAPRDDVLSGAGVGMLLATALRFWGTRTLVFARPAGGPGVCRSGEGRRPPWTG